jgi:hypothetical protein
MLKPSEFTPATNAVLATVLGEIFRKELVPVYPLAILLPLLLVKKRLPSACFNFRFPAQES